MQHFTNKVAVVTGAASGIGRSIALRAAHEGMRVVLADIETQPLLAVEQEIQALGRDALAVRTDVSDTAQIEALAERTMDRFGQVDVLVNNAGVGAGRGIWESSVADWEWVLNINLWSVIHGLRIFVPLMLEQNTPGHIVNTASTAGFTRYHPISAPYQVSKHAVVALTEQLHVSLLLRGAPTKVSVLSPGQVRTRIYESERSRPNYVPQPQPTAEQMPEAIRALMQKVVNSEIEPDVVAEMTFNAIREERFYIFTHPELAPQIRERVERILQAL